MIERGRNWERLTLHWSIGEIERKPGAFHCVPAGALRPVAATTVRRCSSVRHFRESAASILPQYTFRLRMKAPRIGCLMSSSLRVPKVRGRSSCHPLEVSIVLRGANHYMLDEMERSIHDSLSVVKRTLESNTVVARVVARGGAVEAALSVYLENLATTLGSREQLGIAEFAEALLVIPKTLHYPFRPLKQ